MINLTKSEELLKEYGISKPEQIDLEAIAWDKGAEVEISNLDGCEAEIMGNGDKAIITVNSNSPHVRQRFSIGHELGHWMLHRGRNFICRAKDIGFNSSAYDERAANNYAANLVLPNYILKPYMNQFKKLNIKALEKVAKDFKVSRFAAAIKLIEMDELPAMTVTHTRNGRHRFSSAKMVPDKWFPKDELNYESMTFEALFGGRQVSPRAKRISADAWFDCRDAQRYDVTELVLWADDKSATTLLLFEEDRMLEDY